MSKTALRFVGVPGTLTELPFVRNAADVMILCFVLTVMTFGVGMWVVAIAEAALKGVLKLVDLGLLQLLFVDHPNGLWATEQLCGHFLDLCVGIAFFIGITEINPAALTWYNRSRFRFGIGQLLLYVGIAYAIYYGATYLIFVVMQVGAGQAAGPQTSKALLLTSWERVPMLVNTLIVSPILEELMDRGYVFNMMRTSLRHAWAKHLFFAELVALLVSAALFTIMHAFGASSAGLLQIFIAAVIITELYRRTGSLLAPILLHLLLNAANWYQLLHG